MKTKRQNPAFQFRERSSKVDWKAIHDAKVDTIIRKTDINTLQEVVNNITFAQITNEDWPFHSEGMSLKLFRLCQLIIEYLLFAQQQVVDIAKTNAEKCKKLHKQNKELQDKLKLKKEELVQIKNQLKEKEVASAWPCPYCRSRFKTENYLKSHISRRHPEEGCTRVPNEKTEHSRIREIEESAIRRIEAAMEAARVKTELQERVIPNQVNITEMSKMFENMMTQQKELYERAITDRLARIEQRFEEEARTNQAIIQKLGRSEPVLVAPPPAVVPAPAPPSNAGELSDLATKKELQAIIGEAIADAQSKFSGEQTQALANMKNEIREAYAEFEKRFETQKEMLGSALEFSQATSITQNSESISEISQTKPTISTKAPEDTLSLSFIENSQHQMQEDLQKMEAQCKHSERVWIKYGVRDVYCREGHTIENLVPAVGGNAEEFSITPDLPLGLNIDTKTGVIYGTPLEATDVKTPCTIYAKSKCGKKGSVMLTFHFVKEGSKNPACVRVAKALDQLPDLSTELDEIRKICELPKKSEEKLGKHMHATIIQRWWRKRKKLTAHKDNDILQKHLRISSTTLEAEINKLESEWKIEKAKQREKVDESVVPKCLKVQGSIAIVKELEGEYVLMGEEFNGRPAYRMKSHLGAELGPSIFFYKDGVRKSWFLCRSGPKHQYECSAYSKEDVEHPGLLKCWSSKASGQWKPDLNLSIKRFQS